MPCATHVILGTCVGEVGFEPRSATPFRERRERRERLPESRRSGGESLKNGPHFGVQTLSQTPPLSRVKPGYRIWDLGAQIWDLKKQWFLKDLALPATPRTPRAPKCMVFLIRSSSRGSSSSSSSHSSSSSSNLAATVAGSDEPLPRCPGCRALSSLPGGPLQASY